MKILFICPGGQTYLNSPNENLAKFINDNYDDIDIDIFNQRFRPINNINNKYDLVWGDMDGANVPSLSLHLAKSMKIPCYIHGEWIPPYRFETGWSEYFNEPTRLDLKQNYINNLNAMLEADLVSLAINDTPGGFKYIREKTGYVFKNSFIRYPACKEYNYINLPKKHQIATIARVDDGKKRVRHTLDAIALSKHKPAFKVIGGNIQHPDVNVSCLGSFNNDDKVKIFAESKLAVQHWSGIPPAEAIQQYCPVISYDIPYMKELYGDSIIWVERDNIKQLAETIDYYLDNDNERILHAKKAYDMFINNMLSVKTLKYEADLVINKIKKIVYEK